MSQSFIVFLLTWGAGLTMTVGLILARIEMVHTRWLAHELQHSVSAFGGGALLAAVALVLVPQGIQHLSLANVILWFGLGGLSFFVLDFSLSKIGTPAANLVAMLADFIPEALALGAAFSEKGNTGLLLAILVALQNIPEGFNAYREVKKFPHFSESQITVIFLGLSLLGPIAGLTGYFWLVQFPSVVSAIMLFASGGILYLVFQDIAPQGHLKKAWAPPLGAVLGFLLGLIGHILLH